MDTSTPAPDSGRAGPELQAPGDQAGPPGDVPGLPGDADRDDDVDVLFLAGQRPGPDGQWLLVTAADGLPGADFSARILPPDARYAHGGDVLVRLKPDAGSPLPGPAVRVAVWAVLGRFLVPVADWDGQDIDGWPERIRPAAAFAMGVLTELEDHGADLGARYRTMLDTAAAATATAGVPLGVTRGATAPGRW